MKWLICYGACSLLAVLIIWLKQGKYLTGEQPFACFLLGPIALVIAIFAFRSSLTSRGKAGIDG